MKIPPFCWQICLPFKIEELASAELTSQTVPPVRHSLTITTPAEIIRMRREALARGIPTHIALGGEGSWVFLYPTPAEAYDLAVTEYATFIPPPRRARAGGC